MTEEGSIFYKVVKENPLHVLGSSNKTQFSVVYEPGKWTVPEIGKLFVFKELAQAREFSKISYDETWVFKCFVKNPIILNTVSTLIPVIGSMNPIDRLGGVTEFWEEFLKDFPNTGIFRKIRRDRDCSFMTPPAGTVICDEVCITVPVFMWDMFAHEEDWMKTPQGKSRIERIGVKNEGLQAS